MPKNRIKPASRRPVSSHYNRFQNGKIRKNKNGKALAYHTMSGIDRVAIAGLPNMRIGSPFYLQIRHGYVFVYLMNVGVTRLQTRLEKFGVIGESRDRSLKNYCIKLGKIDQGCLIDNPDITPIDWRSIGQSMWPTSTDQGLDRIRERVNKAIYKHLQDKPAPIRQIISL